MRGLPPDLPMPLAERAIAGARWVRGQAAAGRTVTVVHHIDADGVAAGAVALEALRGAGVPSVPLAVKSLDESHVRKVLGSGAEALWFCDLGSTAAGRFADLPRLVCDHHQLVRDGHEEEFPHVNPLLDGLPGDEVSGAGCCYLVAAALDDANLRLLPLALLGATADLQDRHGGFRGCNAALLRHGVASGLLESGLDLAWYGLETRPLARTLAYARDPAVPGATGDRRTAEAFLQQLGLPKDATWSQLEEPQRRQVRSALVTRLLDAGLAHRATSLFREVVRIRAEPPGASTRELQEHATLLNGTARYGRSDVGLAVAAGDRGAAYQEALGLLGGHRKHLVGALDAFRGRMPEALLAVQWIDLQDAVQDTVVGTVCGMALDGLGLPQDLVLVGLAWTPEGQTKASARVPRLMQGRVDLAPAIREAAAAVGGQGGGHAGAAGATFARGSEQRFVRELDRLLAVQLGRAAPRPAAPPVQATLPA
ncbi:MAG TPA: DHHA1 domain-containing protein [Candidatus Thermoplasmatota archaeon]|nr:DHHA1 domain-containing protein [Candidatus Thermoplasmatota archaeon]